MSLVSIILPNYNYGRFLHTAVESLVEQTYEKLELIIVDDGSFDGSVEVIESLKALYQQRFERLDVLYLGDNRGKLYAVNRGIPLACGEITLILDADDYLHQEYIDETVNILLYNRAKNEKIGFVYTDCWLVNSACNPIARGRSTSFDKWLLQTRSYIPQCAPTLTSILQDAEPFDESIRIGTKHHMWRKIASAGWEGLYLEKPLFYYRMHAQNLSGIGRKVLREVEQASQESFILSSYWPKDNSDKGV